jgi:superfamily II DNA/RNA helicase
MFSATYPNAVLKAAQSILGKDQIFVKVGVIGGASSDIVQGFDMVERHEKAYNLIQVLGNRTRDEKILVFVRSKEEVMRLCKLLDKKNFKATCLHSEVERQQDREEALRQFASGEVHILVATSLAARGLGKYKYLRIVHEFMCCSNVLASFFL